MSEGRDTDEPFHHAVATTRAWWTRRPSLLVSRDHPVALAGGLHLFDPVCPPRSWVQRCRAHSGQASARGAGKDRLPRRAQFVGASTGV